MFDESIKDPALRPTAAATVVVTPPATAVPLMVAIATMVAVVPLMGCWLPTSVLFILPHSLSRSPMPVLYPSQDAD